MTVAQAEHERTLPLAHGDRRSIRKYVSIIPLPLISSLPRDSNKYVSPRMSRISAETWMRSAAPKVSIRLNHTGNDRPGMNSDPRSEVNLLRISQLAHDR